METSSSAALAFRHWLDKKLPALGLCGTYSIVERSGETCITIGLLLASILLTKSTHGSARHVFLRDNIGALLSLATTDWLLWTISIGITFPRFCIIMVDTHVALQKVDWPKAIKAPPVTWLINRSAFIHAVWAILMNLMIVVKLFTMGLSGMHIALAIAVLCQGFLGGLDWGFRARYRRSRG